MFLEMCNVSFKYPNSAEYVLNGFQLGVEKGEIVSVVGSSGSGKSTVLRLIAGLEAPAAGTICINQKLVAGDDAFVPPEKRNVGMVFQDYALFPHITVGDNIAFGLRGMTRQERLERIRDLLLLTNMAEYKDRYPYQLSGGQQQRVAVARALAPRPYLLLLDEPFSNIDSTLKHKMRQDIRAILKQENATCIFVTHDNSDVEDMSDRTVHITPASQRCFD